MLRFFKPDITLKSIYDLSAELLREHGIRFLIADLDNTLAGYGSKLPSARLQRWLEQMHEGGIEVAVVSNNSMKRVGDFCTPLEIDHYWKSRKPSRRRIRHAMERLGGTTADTALVGDKTITDICGAKRCGIMAIKVRTLDEAEDGDLK